MNLADLIFWTAANNETGLPNITGTELAALINAGGANPRVGQGVAIRQNGFQTFGVGASVVDFAQGGNAFVDYDDLGFYTDSSPTEFTIPDVDPAITRVVVSATIVFIDSAVSPPTGSRSLNMRLNGADVGTVPTLAFMEVFPDQGSNETTRLVITSSAAQVVAGDVFTFFGGTSQSVQAQVNGRLYVIQ